jgi:small subunit ribosomal protein S14
MAKTSKLAKNARRKVLIERYTEKRAELVKITSDPNASWEEKQAAYGKLNKMPRDASATRLVNRCGVTGRPRAFMRKFGVSRIVFRELANQGMLPGVKKSSW